MRLYYIMSSSAFALFSLNDKKPKIYNIFPKINIKPIKSFPKIKIYK